MALIDTMETILESLRETAKSAKDDSEAETKSPKASSYMESFNLYRNEILEHLAQQKQSVQDSLPVASSSDITTVRKKMDTLSAKINRLRQELNDLEP